VVNIHIVIYFGHVLWWVHDRVLEVHIATLFSQNARFRHPENP